MKNNTLEDFDRYPVYGSRVTALINLLASVAIRMNNDHTEKQSIEGKTDVNK